MLKKIISVLIVGVCCFAVSNAKAIDPKYIGNLTEQLLYDNFSVVSILPSAGTMEVTDSTTVTFEDLTVASNHKVIGLSIVTDEDIKLTLFGYQINASDISDSTSYIYIRAGASAYFPVVGLSGFRAIKTGIGDDPNVDYVIWCNRTR